MNPYYRPNIVLVLGKMLTGTSHLFSKMLPGCIKYYQLGLSVTEQVDYHHHHYRNFQAPADLHLEK